MKMIKIGPVRETEFIEPEIFEDPVPVPFQKPSLEPDKVPELVPA